MKILAIILASILGYVNPFVGTDGHGHTFPGAAYPFGMMQLSPDTRPCTGDWDGCSGYHYSDSTIYGFSHTHLSGTGCDDLCDVLLMPVTGELSTALGREEYGSPFSHEREKASPGYYEVFLDKPQVLARMTVGARAGLHEYTFPEGVAPELVIDLRHRDNLLEKSLVFGDFFVYGMRRSSSWAKDQPIYFYIEFSHSIVSHKDIDGASLITFKAHKNNHIRVRVGISAVSTAEARDNIACEPKISSFDLLRQETEKEWENFLSVLECPFEDEESRKCFYTALYHTAIHPSLFSDADGLYRGMDGNNYLSDKYDRFTIFSLWDTFRGLHPLISEISPDLTLAFIDNFIKMFGEAGKLPVWELHSNETNCMIGYHSASVIADALARGIDGFDVEKALVALVSTSIRDEFGLGSFRRNGLVLADDEHESVSKTLEYAYDDWCVAQVAKWLLEHPERTTLKTDDLENVYQGYMTSAQYWRNVFDPTTGFMRARLNGRWVTPFDPREVNNHYTEGNSWQYSFFVPHDVAGLMRAMGGPTKFCEKIDALFAAPEKTTGRTQVDITGQIGQYAHGNEPSHHIPYLYAMAGKPEKTEAIVKKIMTTLYDSSPAGLCGNDDCGQMSAWYVLSALGRYPVCPGASSDAITFVPKTIVVNPVFEMESDIFENEMTVAIGNIDKGARAYYRIGDGDFKPYAGPFVLTEGGDLECYSQTADGTKSFVTRTSVRRLRTDIKVTLEAKYNPQYNAGGPEGLIDGLRGKLNWRTGGWQGYQGTDFSAVIDLGERKVISEMGAGFCQDARSWIWMPRYVDFLVSDNGEKFVKVAHISHEVADDDTDIQIMDFKVAPSSSKTITARYVKVVAKNYGTIPEWHPGAGGEAFIFVDEFWVK